MTPPVLCYHRIGGPLELGVTRVSLATFRRQMTALARAGWKTLTLSEFASGIVGAQNAAPPHPHTFLLSFDDGYASLADNAYPILADLGFTATTFLITDYMGQENRWDVQYTRERLRHLFWDTVEHWWGRGFSFASHSASHARLTWLGDARVREELSRSREALVGRLGPEGGAALAYPFGATDARIRGMAGEAGYTLGFAGVRGNTHDPLDLPRVPVYMWDAGAVPFGLRTDGVGAMGRLVAHVANRCAVGTSLMKRLAT
jgi:peptidoglycan/xylan/chitin deacetylase (PgdA/CDA1 family)